MIRPELIIFGEVLFDRFPDGSRVLGGAPFNVAWHCQAFGMKPLFISRVGNDPLGQQVRSAMMAWGMDTSGLQLDSAHETGIVDVSFDNGEPSYTIVENRAWDFIDSQATPELNSECILYHGSLASRSPVSGGSLADLRQQFLDSILVDINLRAPWWNKNAIEELIRDCKWIKLNAAELAVIVPQEQSVEARARYLLSVSKAELIVVTQGEAGALAITGEEICSASPETPVAVVDTVGAGDAFCSVLLLGLKKNWPLNDILTRAQQFAGMIVQQQGATSRDRELYKPFIKDWCL